MIRAIFKEPVAAKNQCVGFLIDDNAEVPAGHYSIVVEKTVLPKWLNAIWYMDDGGFTVRPTTDVTFDLDAQAAAEAAEEERNEEVTVAQELAGLKALTPDQAVAYIESEIDLTDYDAAETFAEVKAALRVIIIKFVKVLVRMVPYLLK